MPDAEIGGHEDVGIGKRTHPDVAHGPRTNAGQGKQLRGGAITVGARTEVDIAASDRAGQTDQ